MTESERTTVIIASQAMMARGEAHLLRANADKMVEERKGTRLEESAKEFHGVVMDVLKQGGLGEDTIS